MAIVVPSLWENSCPQAYVHEIPSFKTLASFIIFACLGLTEATPF
jgi:hypothetical protein